MLADFSQIWVQLCCAGNDRVNDLYTAAATVLANTRNCRMNILFNTEKLSAEAKERRTILQALADANHHLFSWVCYPESYSKAQMIEALTGLDDAFLSLLRREWILNVDDDYIIPGYTLQMLANAANNVHIYSKFDVLMYGQFDIINYKKHKNWRRERVRKSDILNVAYKDGLRLLLHHLMEERDLTKENIDKPEVLALPGQSTGSHMFKIKNYVYNHPIRKKMRAWKKGVRGYDDLLCNNLGRVGWIVGSNSYHTDRTKEHLDGKLWTVDVVRDDLKIKRKSHK